MATEPTGATVLRRGGAADLDAVLALLDEAVAWLNARGNTEQWGDTPWSRVPASVARIGDMLREFEPWLAERDGRPLGALVVSDTPARYVPPAAEPELYVNLLVGGREPAARGTGRRLLAHARTLAQRRGVRLLRVDCWAGGGGELVRFYQRAGFTPTAEFSVDVRGRAWPGQLLEQRLTPP
jgi:GNAT superfamily N-acetyltransferase